MYLLIVED